MVIYEVNIQKFFKSYTLGLIFIESLDFCLA